MPPDFLPPSPMAAPEHRKDTPTGASCSRQGQGRDMAINGCERAMEESPPGRVCLCLFTLLYPGQWWVGE